MEKKIQHLKSEMRTYGWFCFIAFSILAVFGHNVFCKQVPVPGLYPQNQILFDALSRSMSAHIAIVALFLFLGTGIFILYDLYSILEIKSEKTNS